jgi:integrative and conjugative element protein (TIGR02256 family)
VQIRNKRVVWIKKSARRFIIDEASHWGDLETGGVLVGYYADDEIVLTKIIGPGPRAEHRRASFKPDSQYHLKELTDVYNKSGRIERYLGDWHTHPNSTSYLSDLDKSTLRKIGGYKKAQLATPIMLVLGTPKMQLKVWIYYVNDVGRGMIEGCRTILFD